MALRTYDPKEVSIIAGGEIVQGYADGTFISIERDEDTWALQIGADGEGARSKSNNRSGTITLTLQQTSASNAILNALAQADELSNGGVFSVLVRDNNGGSLAAAETAWIQKPSNQEYGREAGEREWVIRTDNLSLATLGNVS